MAENIIQFLLELKKLGIKISLEDGKLQTSAHEGVMTKEIVDRITNERADIIKFLQKSFREPIKFEQILFDEENRYDPFPLTDVQQAYWIGRSREFELGNVATHMYMEFEQEELDVVKLEYAWNKLIQRHDMLRAVVHNNGMQQVMEQVPEYKIEILDLRDVEPIFKQTKLMACRNEMSHQVMPADQWPLFDIRISMLNKNIYRIHMSIDLLIADALSWQILFKELGEIYTNPDTELPSVKVTFRDFVYSDIAMKESDLYKRADEYWKKRLENLPPAPELPLIKNPSNIESPQFVRRQEALIKEKWTKLAEHSQRKGFTASVVLMEAYSMVLSNWSKLPKFTINLTLFNRLPLHEDINNVIGDFTSLTLLEIRNEYNKKFTDLTRELQNRLWKDLDNRYVGGIHVMRELNNLHGGGNGPNMPVVFTSDLAHVSQEMMKEIYGISQTPQVWLDHQVIEQNGNLMLNWDSVDEIFPKGMIDDMFCTYVKLLNRLADEVSAWELTMDELLFDAIGNKKAEEREQIEQKDVIINKVNQQANSLVLNQMFHRTVKGQPNHVAVIARNKTLTYLELFELSVKIGNWVKNNNESPLVAILMEKGWEQIASTLGIMHGGFAYIPISVHLPEERICYLLKNGGVSVVLTQSGYQDKINLPKQIKVLFIDRLENYENMPDTLPKVEQSPSDLAYVIYTSGSTGQPKGVAISHEGVANTIIDINNRYGVTKEDRVLAISELNFDLSVYDIFGILVAGGTIVIPDPERKKDPEHWYKLIKEEKITIWNTVPALMEMLMEYKNSGDDESIDSLRIVLLSGDWIPVALPEQIRGKAKNTEIISLGGATEASIWSVCYRIGEVDKEWASIPYGKSLTNQTIYVLDDAFNIRSKWVSGRIYIGGAGLALEYWNDLDMTVSKFVINPKTGERLYNTGDLGRYLEDGNIEFLGREDYQVKIHGHRIELGEIENALGSHPIVKNSVVNVYEDMGKRKLIAYIIKNSAKESLPNTEFNNVKFLYSSVISDPMDRLKFKLKHFNYRNIQGGRKIDLSMKDDFAVRELALKRRSYRRFKEETIQLDTFKSMLSYFQHIKFERLPNVKSVYSSAGSLYPVQIYLYAKKDRIEGIDEGIYYYNPIENSLYLISTNASITKQSFPPGNRQIFERCAFAIFLIGDRTAIEPLYGNWSRDFMIMEAGILSHNFELFGQKHNIGICQIGNYNFNKIGHWFQLDERHLYLHCLLGGGIGDSDKNLESFIGDNQDVIDMAALIKPEDIENFEVEANKIQNPVLEPIMWETNQKEQEVVIMDAIVSEDMKAFLRNKLPDYMIPSAFIQMGQIPLSANGKIDKKALPLPNKLLSGTKKEHVEPQTSLQAEILDIWEEVLGIKKIGIHENIFDLGGNSVDIVKIYNLLNERLEPLVAEKDFQIKEIFRYSTIYEISKFLDSESMDMVAADQEQSSLILKDIHIQYKQETKENMGLSQSINCTNPVFLLTGATGYLGAHILYDLITQTENRIYCLIRGDSKEEAQIRLKKHMTELRLWHESMRDQIVIVCGDFEQDEFGLNLEAYKKLAKDVDIIIHCGSWVNFVYPYEALRNANVQGVREIISLADTYKIKPIHFISSLTSFPISGNTNGKPFYEDEYFEEYEKLANGYSQTKWVGEQLMKEARKRKIPVNIYRPAFMIGHSQTGTANEKDLIWALVKGVIQLGSFADLGAIQLVTVDYVSQFIVNMVVKPKHYNKNYHLISSELTDFRSLFEIVSTMGYEINEDFVDDWIEKIKSLDTTNALSTFLPLLMNLSGLEEESGFEITLFDDGNTQNVLCDTAIEVPFIDGEMLEECLGYLESINFIHNPKQNSTIGEEEEMEDGKRSYKNQPYSLWNPFTDLEEFKNNIDNGPNVIVKAKGAYIYNGEGKRFINAASSLWNVAVGHGREEIIEASTIQMRQLAYSSCFRQTHPKAMELSDKLVEITQGYYNHVYLGCNGSEAVETAFKITRQYFRQSPYSSERSKYKILSLKGSYHGVTIAAISTAGDLEDDRRFGPLVPGFVQIEAPYCYRCPYNKEYLSCNMECAMALEEKIKSEGATTCAAFILEPVMGVHGLIPLPMDYYQKIGEICRKYNVLLIADEVTTGFGRTGQLFASENWTIRPDLLILGKGISSGYLPLSATLATPEVYRRFKGRSNFFNHGSTASGHPVCAAAGLANINIILKENIVNNSKIIGAYLLNRLTDVGKRNELIGEVRGRGMMIGIELVKNKESKEPLSPKQVIRIVEECNNKGLFVYQAPNLRTIGLFPPLIIGKEVADEIVDILKEAIYI